MEYKNLTAVVCGEKKYKENDKLVCLITDRLGKITVIAKGVSKMGSKLSALKLYAVLSVEIKEAKDGLFILTSCENVLDFPEILSDLETQAFVNYILTLTRDMFLPEEPFFELFRLLINTMYLYSKGNRDKELLKSIFELKSLCLAGFAPEVDGCIQCLKDEIDYINVYDGVCLCEECYGASGGDKMSKAVQKAVRHIVKCDEKKLFSFKLSEQAVSSLSAITEKYVKICMEKEYSSLKYLRNIQKGMR